MPVDTVAHDFLVKILETPGASAMKRPVQKLVREYLKSCAETIETDAYGNVIGTANPGGSCRMFLAGHCDQIGLIVQHIDADGYISVQPIGGWDPMQLYGRRCADMDSQRRRAWRYEPKANTPAHRRRAKNSPKDERPLD